MAELRTGIVKSRSPDFNQLLSVPVLLPSASDVIEISVFDYDVLNPAGCDDAVASLRLSLAHLQRLPGTLVA